MQLRMLQNILAAERDRMISAGEIDIGRLICPITEVLHRNGSTKEQIVFGRAIALKNIIAGHLRSMAAKGLLKKKAEKELSLEQLKARMRKYGGEYHINMKPIRAE